MSLREIVLINDAKVDVAIVFDRRIIFVSVNLYFIIL